MFSNIDDHDFTVSYEEAFAFGAIGRVLNCARVDFVLSIATQMAIEKGTIHTTFRILANSNQLTNRIGSIGDDFINMSDEMFTLLKQQEVVNESNN
jgi:hypothetical protein